MLVLDVDGVKIVLQSENSLVFHGYCFLKYQSRKLTSIFFNLFNNFRSTNTCNVEYLVSIILSYLYRVKKLLNYKFWIFWSTQFKL